ncbi:unnamed protein product [Jaminaea pallidilutea]
MATSPQASPTRSRRRHHTRNAAVGGGSGTQDSVSSLMGSSADHPATTTTVRSSTANDGTSSRTSRNPLLEPNVTASDLFSQYTPNEIANHLAAVKTQLQTYDAELKALINSRYEDVLSVGNTISAMTGSSEQLKSALEEVAQGLRSSKEVGAEVQGTASEEEDEQARKEREAREEVRYVAALLLVLQEGPEEIWRILDTVGTFAEGDANQVLPAAKGRLRAARQLGTAVSLYEAIRQAGYLLDGMTIQGRQAKDIFPYPLSTLGSTLSSLVGELKSALEDLLRRTSVIVPLTMQQASLPMTRAALEASYRTSATCLASLAALRGSSPAEAAGLMLEIERQVLDTNVQAIVAAGATATDLMNFLLASITETAYVYTRAFTAAGAASDDPDAPSSERSSSLKMVKLMTSIEALPSSERIVATLSATQAFQEWPSRLDVLPTESERADMLSKLSDWRHSIQQDLGATSSSSQSTMEPLKTVKATAQARYSLLSQSRRLLKLVSGSQGALGSVEAIRDEWTATLRSRAEMLWQRDVQQWKEAVVGRLRSSLSAVSLHHGGEPESGMLDELFEAELAPASERHGNQRNRKHLAGAHHEPEAPSSKQLQRLLEGRYPSVQLVLDIELRKGWQKLSRSQARYFAEWVRGEDDDDKATVSERDRWNAIAQSQGWTPLVEAVHSMFEEHATDEAQVLLLARIVRNLFASPQNKALSQVFDERQKDSLLAQRSKALQSWRQRVAQEAAGRMLPAAVDNDETHAGQVSASLVRAVHGLMETSDQVVPLLCSPADRSFSTVDSATTASPFEIGSLNDLAVATGESLLHLLQQRAQSSADASLPATLHTDIAALSQIALDDVEESSQRFTGVQDIFSALQKKVAQMSDGKPGATGPEGVDVGSALAPVALLLGQGRYLQTRRQDEPPSSSTQQSAPSLLKLAGQGGTRLRGVQV